MKHNKPIMIFQKLFFILYILKLSLSKIIVMIVEYILYAPPAPRWDKHLAARDLINPYKDKLNNNGTLFYTNLFLLLLINFRHIIIVIIMFFQGLDPIDLPRGLAKGT
ncbi:hypothetical protein PFDG_05126 [Plasmodium falciparum Dd2]|uniref:Uncharacterized protein n=1 Tax=Plasmodium falciparum (isolate Dd2) TaxID=57267 RepID=A0A0L7M9S6_PLAF4|nr:hypothetical protein PFDG_05126 [Plasmodium falciparum Dd2]